MDSCYRESLKVCIPVLGLCSAGIQLSTIRARFINSIPVSAEINPEWPLRKVLTHAFFNLIVFINILLGFFSFSRVCSWFLRSRKTQKRSASPTQRYIRIYTAISSKTLPPFQSWLLALLFLSRSLPDPPSWQSRVSRQPVCCITLCTSFTMCNHLGQLFLSLS